MTIQNPIHTFQAVAASAPLAEQSGFVRARYDADGRLEYAFHGGRWEQFLHKAYWMPWDCRRELGYSFVLDPARGGHLLLVKIAVYAADAEPPGAGQAAQDAAAPAGGWRDCVAVMQPPGANAAPLFLSHHGVYEDRTLLTAEPRRAVVCGGVDGDAAFRPARRVVSFAPYIPA